MKKLLLISLIGASSCLLAADGATIYNKKCKACHGPTANIYCISNKKVPPLNTLKAEEMVTAMKGYKAGTNNKFKTGVLMKGQMATLKDEDMEAVAKYITTLKK